MIAAKTVTVVGPHGPSLGLPVGPAFVSPLSPGEDCGGTPPHPLGCLVYRIDRVVEDPHARICMSPEAGIHHRHFRTTPEAFAYFARTAPGIRAVLAGECHDCRPSPTREGEFVSMAFTPRTAALRCWGCGRYIERGHLVHWLPDEALFLEPLCRDCYRHDPCAGDFAVVHGYPVLQTTCTLR